MTSPNINRSIRSLEIIIAKRRKQRRGEEREAKP